LLTSLAGICLYPLLVFIPGYAIAWLANLFGFRRRTPEFRVALSIPLSISTCPISIYLIGRFVSMPAVAAVLVAASVGFAVLLIRNGLTWPRFSATAWSIVLGWLAIALFTSVDLQIGAKDYYPVTAFDYSLRAEFIQSISTRGIPPGNPFFFPGHTAPLRYHYFWLLL